MLLVLKRTEGPLDWAQFITPRPGASPVLHAFTSLPLPILCSWKFSRWKNKLSRRPVCSHATLKPVRVHLITRSCPGSSEGPVDSWARGCDSACFITAPPLWWIIHGNTWTRDSSGDQLLRGMMIKVACCVWRNCTEGKTGNNFTHMKRKSIIIAHHTSP